MSKQHKPEKKAHRPGSGLMTGLVIAVLLAAIGWQLKDLRQQVKDAEAEKAHYAQQVALQQRENDALAAGIAEGPTQEKVEEIAREELGLVTPNEYVFYDASN